MSEDSLSLSLGPFPAPTEAKQEGQMMEEGGLLGLPCLTRLHSIGEDEPKDLQSGPPEGVSSPTFSSVHESVGDPTRAHFSNGRVNSTNSPVNSHFSFVENNDRPPSNVLSRRELSSVISNLLGSSSVWSPGRAAPPQPSPPSPYSGSAGESASFHPIALDASSNVEPFFASASGNNTEFNSLKTKTSVCLPKEARSSPFCRPPSRDSSDEPTILADTYVVLGPVDATTSAGARICDQQPVHIKAVSARTASEVCAHHSLLTNRSHGSVDPTGVWQCERTGAGVRTPMQAVMNGRRAWLVFGAHYGDLHSYVRRKKRIREAEAQRLFGCIAATVAACHGAGLVLRDLKLRKFVFADAIRHRVVLESVEDAVVCGDGDLLHDKHGCPAYVAPEILASNEYSGRHADMWSLGVILYTMLVGRYPFHNADTSLLFAHIRSGKFCLPPWLSSRARHLILRLLHLLPHKRLSADQVLVHPWLTRRPADRTAAAQASDHVVPNRGPKSADFAHHYFT